MTDIEQLNREIAEQEKIHAQADAAIRYTPGGGFTGLDAQIEAATKLKALQKPRWKLWNGIETKAPLPPHPTLPPVPQRTTMRGAAERPPAA